MGAIDDIRKVVQDLVTPDLKALAARLEVFETSVGHRFESLEKTMDAEFAAIDAKFAAVDIKFEGVDTKFAGVDTKLDSLEKSMDAKLDSLKAKLELVDTGSRMRDDAILARLDGLSLKIDANYERLVYALNIDKRLDAIERDRRRELSPAA